VFLQGFWDSLPDISWVLGHNNASQSFVIVSNSFIADKFNFVLASYRFGAPRVVAAIGIRNSISSLYRTRILAGPFGWRAMDTMVNTRPNKGCVGSIISISSVSGL